MRFRRAARLFFAASCLVTFVAPATPSLAQGSAPTAAPKPAHAAPAPKPAASAPPKPGGGSAPAKPTPTHAPAKPAQHPPAPAKPEPAKPSGKASSKAPAGKPGKKGDKIEKNSKRVLARKPGSEAGEPDEAVRRMIAGNASTKSSKESTELRAMRELDLALFPSNEPNAGAPWEADGSILINTSEPRVHTSGMPPSAAARGLEAAPKPASDLSWLRTLTMPDIPVRWDERVVRYLEYYKDNPRGRSMVAGWIRRSGRFGAAIRRVLREQGLPEDILWLSLVESGFDPTIQSPAGAAGLWQFMPDGARIYGLTVDRWIDERLDPERSTLAAARYLADLRQRFGGWELAFAAYNMGYGGLLASIRKYNTNDFWELSRLEAGMPLETALYVPKIVAMAIVSRNRAVFGCADVELDAAVSFDKVSVSSGISLKTVAAASGAGVTDIEGLNPQILAGRTPPLSPGSRDESKWVVRVPPGSGASAAKSIGELVAREAKLERYVVRWGESLDDIATTRGTWRSVLMSLNDLRRDEVIRPGTVIFVPALAGGGSAAASMAAESPPARPFVVVPAQAFVYPTKRRVFYRVIAGDTVRDVAAILGVTADELCRWNTLDPSAALHEGMALQAYLPKEYTPPRVFLLEEKDATVLKAGSTEFFTHFEGLKGRKRMEVAARSGDTFSAIARRYGLTMGMLERINHRSRSTAVNPGDKFVVYIPSSSSASSPSAPVAPREKPEVGVALATAAAPDVDGDETLKDKDDETKAAALPMTPDDPAGDAEKEPASPPASPSPPSGKQPSVLSPRR